MHREAANDYPTLGNLKFLVESYSSKFYFFEVVEVRVMQIFKNVKKIRHF